MPTTKRTTQSLLAALVVISVAALLHARAAALDMTECGQDVVLALPSADGALVAYVVKRDCGATTARSTVVGLRKRNEPKSIANADAVLILDGKCDVEIHWQGDTLSVARPLDCIPFMELHARLSTTVTHTFVR